MENQTLVDRLEACKPLCKTPKEEQMLDKVIHKMRRAKDIKIPLDLVGRLDLPVSSQVLYGILQRIVDKEGKIILTNRILSWLVYPSHDQYYSSPSTGATLLRILSKAGYVDSRPIGVKNGGHLKQAKLVILPEKQVKNQK